MHIVFDESSAMKVTTDSALGLIDNPPTDSDTTPHTIGEMSESSVSGSISMPAALNLEANNCPFSGIEDSLILREC